MSGRSKIGNFLKKIEECSIKNPRLSHVASKNNKDERSIPTSLSPSGNYKKSPSTKALVALGILSPEDITQLSRPSRKASKSKAGEKATDSRVINKSSSSKTIVRNGRLFLGRSTTTESLKEEPDQLTDGSRTDRAMNVVNNFNVKINEEGLNDKVNYEIADLKLDLQMKSLEISSLYQAAKDLKKINRRLEQDNLQLRQELEETNDKLTKAVQNWDYFKSLSQLKSDELVSLNAKVSQLKKQIISLGTDYKYQQSMSSWGNSLMKVISESKPELSNSSPFSTSGLSDSTPAAKNKEQVKKLILEVESSGKSLTGEAVLFLADCIQQPSLSPAQKKEAHTEDKAEFSLMAAKMAFLLNTYREVVKEDFVTRRELHKTTASIHQHYVTRMNMKQLEFQQQLSAQEKTIAKYRKLLSAQLDDPNLEVSGPLESFCDDRLPSSYIDNEELDWLQNHDIEGVRLIYNKRENH